MAIDTSVPRTRRALLAGGVGGLVALAAAALGRPLTADAADGDTVKVGGEYIASSVTSFDAGSRAEIALLGSSRDGEGVRGTSDAGIGVCGAQLAPDPYGQGGAGVEGSSTWGVGVRGISWESSGVYGTSQEGPGVQGGSAMHSGVHGTSMGAAPAVLGMSRGHDTGVMGYSGTGEVATPAKTGVYGYAAQDTNARGVTGQTTVGRGVSGIATTGIGVYGTATSGYALWTSGRVKLDKCAGVATIAAGTSSKTVTPGIDLVSTSAVVATLNGNAGGSTTVKRVAVNTTANTFTIYLTGQATQSVKVAWHVFG